MLVQRGFRGKLGQYFERSQSISICFDIKAPFTYDITCFGIDGNEKLSDDRYMVFYNQLNTPENSVRMEQNGTMFHVELEKIPNFIQKLAFTISIDGNGMMKQLEFSEIRMKQLGKEDVIFSFDGKDFEKEKAIIAIEFYKKEEWRFQIVARGFNGGLPDLLSFFGGVEDTSEVPEKEEKKPIQKVSLEKKLERNAPKLVSLAKPIQIVLEKRNLNHVIARVALVLDISGSMTVRYKNGTVQSIVNKVLPLAVQFDDDGKLDFWYYGTTAKRMKDVTMDNYECAVPQDWKKLMRKVGGTNNEPVVMKEIIAEYQKSKLPAFVIFITDGGVAYNKKIEQLLRESSSMPIFWQYVGVGGSGYGILEKFDTLSGRVVDNAGFFALDDFNSIDNQTLYDRLLSEFPLWLKAAKNAGILL